MDENNIKLVVTDVDGVLTDSGYIIDYKGNISKRFNTRDFYAIKYLINEVGIPVMGLSGAKDPATIYRFQSEEIPLAHGIMNKISFMDQIAEKMGINFDQIAFIGDHWIDMPVLKKVNLSFCPIDAIEEVKTIS